MKGDQLAMSNADSPKKRLKGRGFPLSYEFLPGTISTMIEGNFLH